MTQEGPKSPDQDDDDDSLLMDSARSPHRARSLEIRVEVLVEATLADGRSFYLEKGEATTYDQDGYALATINRIVHDMKGKLVDLGFQAARLHGEGPQDES